MSGILGANLLVSLLLSTLMRCTVPPRIEKLGERDNGERKVVATTMTVSLQIKIRDIR